MSKARSQTYRQTHRQSDYWGHPFRVSRFFSFNLSSRIGPIHYFLRCVKLYPQQLLIPLRSGDISALEKWKQKCEKVLFLKHIESYHVTTHVQIIGGLIIFALRSEQDYKERKQQLSIVTVIVVRGLWRHRMYSITTQFMKGARTP